MGLIAMTRELSPAIVRCQLTHLARTPIDVAAAARQHDAYEHCLQQLGCTVVRLDAGEEMADSVFIEDTAVVFDEVAVVMRPGAESRRGETSAVAAALAPYRSVVHIEEPATIDGGDVLVAGRQVFVGASGRTSRAGFEQLVRIATPLGYTLRAVAVRGCLHLKSAVTCVADGMLLINPDCVDVREFEEYECMRVDPQEPAAANALRVGDAVVYPTAFPATRQRLEARRLTVHPVDVGELAKAEGAVTCCSVIFRGRESLLE